VRTAGERPAGGNEQQKQSLIRRNKLGHTPSLNIFDNLFNIPGNYWLGQGAPGWVVLDPIHGKSDYDSSTFK
jgi:hypothetical protein